MIAISFSAFDDFEIPEETDDSRISYRYWGLRDNDDSLLSTDQLLDRIHQTVNDFHDDQIRIFTEYLKSIAPNIHLSDLSGKRKIMSIKNKTSAGQRIMLSTLTGLVSFLKDSSLLLFDEPETHLHPSMLANMMSIIDGLLEDFNSYAIISTHSPIVLQQVPSAYIRIVRRMENTPVIDNVPIETFGENLTEISQEIFDVSDYERDYKDIFLKLLKENSPEKILTMFDNPLGISAKALLYSLSRKGRGI